MVALTRDVPSAMMTALAGTFFPVLFVYLDWPGGAIRVHSSSGTITWGGYDWDGVGQFGSVSLPGEFGGMVNTEAQLSLMGDPETLDEHTDAAIRNRDAVIYFGCLTSRAGSTLVSDPVVAFSGQMDVYSLEANEAGHAAVVSLITGPGARRDAAVYHSDQDQALKFPGDTAGRLLALAVANAQKTTWPES